MTRDVNQERLERLKGELAQLRARAAAADTKAGPRAEPTDAGPGTVTEVANADVATAPPAAASPEEPIPRSYSTRAPSRPRPAQRLPVEGREPRAASREAQRSATPPEDILGRRRIPRPPRRNPFRPRAQRPPRRVAVPTPVAVPRRSPYLAAPRWPQVGALSGLIILLVMVPVVAQLVYRLWTAMNETSVLLGADPSRIDALRAAAGVAGGGLTMTAAVAALGVVRGRVGYLAGAGSVFLLFVAFPYVAYTSNAGIVAAPLPTLNAMITPEGWAYGGALRAVFLLASGSLLVAIGDLVQRSISAVQRGMDQARR